MKNHSSQRLWGVALSWCLCLLTATGQVTIDIDAGLRGPEISKRHYGIFFEEINHAGDGGLYAELIRNRSFEDNATLPDGWTASENSKLEVVTDNLMNTAQGKAARWTMSTQGASIGNTGFWGINIVKGQTYRLTFWTRSSSTYKSTLTARLLNQQGNCIGETPVQVNIGQEWSKVTADITATGTDGKGTFSLKAARTGTLYLDMVSLFPPTYKNRPNGCRTDLAEKLEAMRPSFVRFPGGCYVEGQYDNGSTNRFEWKKTIGPVEQRPGHLNRNWNYRVSDGMGYHEFLQLTEDLGAEPLFVVNMGLGHGWMEDYRQINEYIQEALDAVEYANGDITTPYGRLRAENGHPEPFNLRLLEIGNENYNFSSQNNSDQSDHYAERYYEFYKALKAKYPEVTLIGNVEAWGTDNPSWRNAYPVEVVDEHYYRSPTWFVNQYEKYNTYPRSHYKVYVGEYAVTQNFGTNGNLNAALGEAVYMLGMENNSDVCVMNSYAPIFVNENDQTWRPDMIRFNSETSYGTPSYYVQQLFPNNVGRQNVIFTETNNTFMSHGTVGVGTWNTAATFENLAVTAPDGTPVYQAGFNNEDARNWTMKTGDWSLGSGVLAQTSESTQGATAICNLNLTEDYTLRVDATKQGGQEGFLIIFNYQDENNYCWWNIGGWNNSKHGVEMCCDGVKTTLAETGGSLATGEKYAISIRLRGTQVECYLNDTQIHSFRLPVSRKIYASANIDDETGELFIKLVNPGNTAQSTTLNITNATVTGASATCMSASTGLAENTTTNPTNVAPVRSTVTVNGNKLLYNVPAYSVNILKVNVTDIRKESETPTEELPEPLLQYSFDGEEAADDSHTYTGTLEGEASVVTLKDGNRALYTGPVGGGGYMNLGTRVGAAVLSRLTGAYTISIDIMSREANNLAQYGWAYAFANGTESYIGLVNKAGNGNWYYEIKKNSRAEQTSGNCGLDYNRWHNLTFVQDGAGYGTLYVDGFPVTSDVITAHPHEIADAVTDAFIGRSPYAADVLMENMYFDNLTVYPAALTAKQVKALARNAQNMEAFAASPANEEKKTEVERLFRKLNYLHTDTPLPVSFSDGTTLSWSCRTIEEGYVSIEDHTLKVWQLPKDAPVKAAELTVHIRFADEQTATMSHTVTVAPDDNRGGYLYCFMNAQTEITNYALGTAEDKGHRFDVLLSGGEVFDTQALAEIEHGTRDAYMNRGESNDGYFITTTDMCQRKSGVWNNYGINLLHSDDMIHWTGTTFDFRKGKRIFSDPEAATGCYNTDAEYANIHRVWAPQFIWDKDYDNGRGGYLVYYSLLSTNPGDTYDKIYYSHTDREFKTLTQPRLLFDPERAVIDADIVFNPYDSLYHMYYKKEGADSYERGIYEAVGTSLTGNAWIEIAHITNEGGNQVEGSSTVRRINEDMYNVYYMRYSGGNAYRYCETDFTGETFSASANLLGTGSFQHGSVLTITGEEYNMLQAWSDVRLMLPAMRQLNGMAESEEISNAIRQAEDALEQTSVSTLATALRDARKALQDARNRYEQEEWEKACNGQPANLSFKLANPDFSEGGTGWNGTSFTAASSGVAEHYNKTFDTYQELDNMPAGRYLLTAQGFYRYGSIDNARTARLNGTEKLQASLYLNDKETPFMSLYDASAPYTFSPYTYPDGVSGADKAFNTDKAYKENSVEYTLATEGTLRTGIRKTASTSADWTCFDNFRLYYLGNTTGITPVTDRTGHTPVNVFTIDGSQVRRRVKAQEATEGLPAGVYIVEHEKKVVR